MYRNYYFYKITLVVLFSCIILFGCSKDAKFLDSMITLEKRQYRGEKIPIDRINDLKKEINRYDNPDDPRFSDYSNEEDVPIQAGDLVIGDGRMFHAAHSNDSERWRTVITIWILPFFDNLLEPVRSWFNHDYHVIHDNWPNTALNKINPLIPNYNGNVEPTDMIQDIEIHRTPDNRLN